MGTDHQSHINSSCRYEVSQAQTCCNFKLAKLFHYHQTAWDEQTSSHNKIIESGFGRRSKAEG